MEHVHDKATHDVYRMNVITVSAIGEDDGAFRRGMAAGSNGGATQVVD